MQACLMLPLCLALKRPTAPPGSAGLTANGPAMMPGLVRVSSRREDYAKTSRRIRSCSGSSVSGFLRHQQADATFAQAYEREAAGVIGWDRQLICPRRQSPSSPVCSPPRQFGDGARRRYHKSVNKDVKRHPRGQMIREANSGERLATTRTNQFVARIAPTTAMWQSGPPLQRKPPPRP